VTALLLLFVGPLVQAVFRFDPQDTALVVGAARVYLLGLLGHSLLEVGARAFYAQQDARTPLRVTAVGLTTFAVCAMLLFRPLGANGIALANSIAFTLEAVLLLLMLRRTYPSVGRVRGPAARTLLGSAAACAAALLAWSLIPSGGFVAATVCLMIGSVVAFPFVLPELRQMAVL